MTSTWAISDFVDFSAIRNRSLSWKRRWDQQIPFRPRLAHVQTSEFGISFTFIIGQLTDWYHCQDSVWRYLWDWAPSDSRRCDSSYAENTSFQSESVESIIDPETDSGSVQYGSGARCIHSHLLWKFGSILCVYSYHVVSLAGDYWLVISMIARPRGRGARIPAHESVRWSPVTIFRSIFYII